VASGEEENVAEMQVELIGHEGHKAGIGVVFDPDTHALASTQAYFVAQVNLFAEMCRGRNQGSAGLLMKHEPIYNFDVVLKMMSKDMFPSNLRAAFCRLMLNLYLDSFDFVEAKKIPMLVRPDVSKWNCFERSSSQIPFLGEAALKAFIVDYLSYCRVISNADVQGNFNEDDCRLLLVVIELLMKMIKLGFLTKQDVQPIARALTRLLDSREREESMSSTADQDGYIPKPSKVFNPSPPPPPSIFSDPKCDLDC